MISYIYIELEKSIIAVAMYQRCFDLLFVFVSAINCTQHTMAY